MLKSYPKFKRKEIESVLRKLPKTEKQTIEKYLEYRKARGITTEQKSQDLRRYMIQIRKIIQKDFNRITLEDLRKLLGIINSSHLSNYTKNNLKVDIKNFLKWNFKNWSMKFADLEDIRTSNGRNEEKINAATLLKKSDIEKIMKHETKMFWKAFFITQYEGGLRTIEIRHVRWDDIELNVDGDISSINIYATKTKKARTIFVKEATFYLKRLQEQQENTKQKGIYVFHSKRNVDKPIDKGTVSSWMRNLTEKALGRKCWSYLLRHSKATELYKLAKQNKISKDTAIKFMGHSKDMSEVYTHLDDADVKEMLKNQVYKLEELPKENKNLIVEVFELLIESIKNSGVPNKEIEKLNNALSKIRK